MADLELRRAKRYRLVAPSDYWWLGQGMSIKAGRGMTQNISNIGAMITSDECPPLGSRIEVTVFIPRRPDSRDQLKLHGEGFVVRVEENTMVCQSDAKGFAASVQFYPEPLGNAEETCPDRSES